MSRSFPHPRGVAALATLFALGMSVTPVLAQPTVECGTEVLKAGSITDLGGRFRFHVSASATEPYELVSELLVLDREGEILQVIPVGEGDVFQFALRDQVFIKEQGSGHPRDWLIHAPGVLFRSKVTEGFLTSYAYCSPYAAIRVDQPEDLVFTATTASPQADVRLTVGVAQMDPASIRILVDCVDIVAATGAAFPGGPYGGVVEIAGTPVTIQDMVGDLDHGTISFTLLDLPGGAHLVRVSGTPVYDLVLPPGHTHWNRPLGALLHEATISVFRTEITSPTDGAELALAPTTIEGVITHGLPPTTLRVHGMNVPLPPPTFLPGDGCVGDAYRVEFSTQIPVADVQRDLTSGDDQVSSLDPGVNFVTALATDEGAHVANDRVRFSLGAVQPAADVLSRRDPTPQGAASNGDCAPAAEIPGFVRHGFAVSLSELAMSEALKAKLLPGISASLTASLNSLVGTEVEAQLDPCPGGLLRDDVTATVRFQGRSYDPASFLEMLRAREASLRPAGGLRPQSRSDLAPDRFTVAPADAPDLDPIGDQTVEVNQTLVVTLNATDPDDDPITYSLDAGPANSRVVENRFEFHPSCDELGAHAVTVRATADGESDTESFTVTVNEPEIPDTYNARFTGVSFDPSTMDVHAVFAGADEVRIVFDSGPLVFNMTAGDCYGDCLFDCCVSWSVDFDILMDNVQLTAILNANQLLCGVADPSEIPDPGVEISGLDVNFGDPHIGGVFGWLSGATLLAELLNVFGVPQALLDAFASDYIVDQIDQPIEDSIVNQFPGVEFSGLHEMGFSAAIPGVPVSLETRFSDLPRIDPGQAISMGIHSAFTAIAPEDPAPPWYPTFSEVPNVGALGGDFAIATSDDGLNQLMSSLVAAGQMRARFPGHTIGEFVPGLSIPELGITSETPILLTVDAAQDPYGNAIPPIVGFIDDATTLDVFEAKVRVQLSVRGILERGQPVPDDRSVCSCTSLSPSCVGQPCLIYESVLKLNFITHVSLNEIVPGFLASLTLSVAEIQQLSRPEGFDSFEATDFTDDEDDIVATSADSPALALLRDEINDALPPLLIPPEALTLDGWVVPANLRLFMAQVDGAGLGDQDYFGLLADVVPAAARPSDLVAIREPQDGATSLLRSPDRMAERPAPRRPAGEAEALGAGFELAQNFPNPFRGGTTIRAVLPRATDYRLTIFNAAGAVVRTFEGAAAPGVLDIRWDGEDQAGRRLASGVYVCRFEAGGYSMSRKMLRVQ
jgi:hypothetical protein